MREIKFRAWFQGKMWESYVMNDDGEMCCYTDYGNGPENIKDKKIVMQYTGLRDRRGKEIYEFDIVSSIKDERHSEVNAVVNFEEGAFCFGSGIDDALCVWIRDSPGVIVIGNIYENPELLEKK